MNFRGNTLGSHILKMAPTQGEITYSRLGDTGLYDAEAHTLLYGFLDVFRGTYALDISFEKLVEDPITNKTGYASEWNTGACGGHDYSISYIKSQGSKSMDRFIDEYPSGECRLMCVLGPQAPASDCIFIAFRAGTGAVASGWNVNSSSLMATAEAGAAT